MELNIVWEQILLVLTGSLTILMEHCLPFAVSLCHKANCLTSLDQVKSLGCGEFLTINITDALQVIDISFNFYYREE